MVNFIIIVRMVLATTILIAIIQIAIISITKLITITNNNNNNTIKTKSNKTSKCKQIRCIPTQTKKNKNSMINKSINLII